LIKINITPGKPQHLPVTQAQRNCDQPARLKSVTRRRSQKQPRLLGVERVNLNGRQRRWVDGGYRVPRNQLPPHRNTQRSAEKRVEPSHAPQREVQQL
jgi:hypothetical protein